MKYLYFCSIFLLCIFSSLGNIGVSAATVDPQPTLTMSLNPSIVQPGQSSTLSWISTYATQCGFGFGSGNIVLSPIALSGSQLVQVMYLYPSATFTITCNGTGGSITKNVILTMDYPKPTLTFTADPTELQPNQFTTIRWESTEASQCYWGTGTNNNEPSIPLSGTYIWIAPSSTMTLYITCNGLGGSITKSITLTVFYPKPTLTLTLDPAIVQAGQSSRFTWSSTNATQCNWGTGSNSPYYPPAGLSGSFLITAPTTSTLTMNCSSSGGVDTKSITLTVFYPKPTLTLTLDPAIVQAGQSSRFTWSSTNATQCNWGTGTNSVYNPLTTLSGSFLITAPTATSTITMNCSSSGGIDTKSITLIVIRRKPLPIILPPSPEPIIILLK